MVFTWVLAANAHFAATYTPFMLTGLGAAFSSSSIANAANHVTSNGAVAAISVGVMVIVAALSIFSLKRLAQVILRSDRPPAGRVPGARAAARRPLAR